MKIRGIALSDIGLNRYKNEDNLYFNQECRPPQLGDQRFVRSEVLEGAGHLFAIADGIGGEAMGEQASYLAVSGLKGIEAHFQTEAGKSFPLLMPRYLRRVNERMMQLTAKAGAMGATFSALYLSQAGVQCINIGDSPIYRYRQGFLDQLSCDHTSAQVLVERYLISPEELKQHPERHCLTQYLGKQDHATLEAQLVREQALAEGDLYLICTDGLSDALSEEATLGILASGAELEEKGKQLLQEALRLGGKDNISLILLEVLGEGLLPEGEPFLDLSHPLGEAVALYPELLRSDVTPVQTVVQPVSEKRTIAGQLSEVDERLFEEARQRARERLSAEARKDSGAMGELALKGTPSPSTYSNVSRLQPLMKEQEALRANYKSEEERLMERLGKKKKRNLSFAFKLLWTLILGVGLGFSLPYLFFFFRDLLVRLGLG